jgi:small GTP-binding protein
MSCCSNASSDANTSANKEVRVHREYETSKVVMLGRSNSGKTTLIHRFRTGKFEQLPATVALDYNDIKQTYQGKEIRFQLWDTAGQEKYNCFTEMYLRNAEIAIITASLDDKISQDDLTRWIQTAKQSNPEIQYIIVGSKSDLVSEDSIDTFMTSLHSRHDLQPHSIIITSSISGHGIDNLFETILSILSSQF